MLSPRAKAQFLPLALARERGWFPQLPPGGIWAQGRRLSRPALSQDLGGAERGAHAESEADARRWAEAGGLELEGWTGQGGGRGQPKLTRASLPVITCSYGVAHQGD